MSRIEEGGISELAKAIEEDLSKRQNFLNKPSLEAISDITASVLMTQSVNTSELSSVLPREIDDESKYRYINRNLSNPKVKVSDVMGSYIPEVAYKIYDEEGMVCLSVDQSIIGNGFEMLMVSMRLGDRAIPVLYKVVETKGAIGFAIQEQLLDEVYELMPKDISIMLLGDRFYGTSALVSWCQKHGWQYRLRLKGNLIFEKEGWVVSVGKMAETGIRNLEGFCFNKTDIKTNIGMLHDKGHKEPWIIAMDAKPTREATMEYKKRWSIESMFSDLKSRGFNIGETKLEDAGRIERMLMILSIALLWAVSTGMALMLKNPPKTKSKKNSFVLSNPSSN